MKQSEISAVMKYALHKSTSGAVEVCTIAPTELAQAFLASFQMTTTVYGENSWTDRDHLRRSIRHSQRQSNGTDWIRRGSLRESLRMRKSSLSSLSIEGSGHGAATRSRSNSPTGTRLRSNSMAALSSPATSRSMLGLPRSGSSAALTLSPQPEHNPQATSPLAEQASGSRRNSVLGGSFRRRSLSTTRYNRFAGRALE